MGGPALVLGYGRSTGAAALVTEHSAHLVPDPPAFGGRRLHTIEPAAEFFVSQRIAAQGLVGAEATIDRAVITIPTDIGIAGAHHSGAEIRGQLVSAAEAAGFTAVELLVAAVGAVWVPGSPLRVRDLVLVYDIDVPNINAHNINAYGINAHDMDATFEATLVRVGDDRPEILGHSTLDWPVGADRAAPGWGGPATAVELTLACCRDLLGRLGVSPTQVAWVLPVGSGARWPGIVAGIEPGLGIAVALVEEPETAVVRGAATWLTHSGPRLVAARGSGQRLAPLAYTFPAGQARLLRWLVEPQQSYAEGAAVARVRLAEGAVWDLTARAAGTLDEVLIPGGREVHSGEWLALVRPA